MDDMALKTYIEGDITNFEASIAKAVVLAQRFEDQYQQSMKKAAESATMFTTAVDATVSALRDALKFTIGGIKDSFDELYKQGRMADAFTSTVPAIREFSYALDKIGIGADSAKNTLSLFERAIGAAITQPLSRQRKVFQELGLDVIKLGKGEPVQALESFFDVLEKFPTAAQRASYLQDILSRSGRAMLPLIGHFKEAREEFRKLTGYSSGGKNFEIGLLDYKAIEMAKEGIVKLTAVWDNFTTRLAIKVAPFISNIADKLVAMFDPKNVAEWTDYLIKGFHDVLFFVIDIDAHIIKFISAIPTLFMDIRSLIMTTIDQIGSHMTEVFVRSLRDVLFVVDPLLQKLGYGKEADSMAMRLSFGAVKANAASFISGGKRDAAANKWDKDWNDAITKGDWAKRFEDWIDDLSKLDSKTFWDKVANSLNMNVNARNADLSLAQKEGKTTPLGYAINATGMRASLQALRLAATPVQSVNDERGNALLEQIVRQGGGME